MIIGLNRGYQASSVQGCHPAAQRRDLHVCLPVVEIFIDPAHNPFAQRAKTARMPPMPEVHMYWVYILSSRSRTLYIGVTNRLVHRVLQHREGRAGSFTTRYRITRLVYYEQFRFIQDAIAREKELKDWRCELKIELIERDNPSWTDLAEGWSRTVETPQYDWKRERE
jgi:putative endonuclease